jgi:hypothetical protein
VSKTRKVKTPLLEKIRKRTSIEKRLLLLFKANWMSDNIIPERPATEEELVKANTWAKKMALLVAHEYKWWERDGKPKRKVKKK